MNQQPIKRKNPFEIKFEEEEKEIQKQEVQIQDESEFEDVEEEIYVPQRVQTPKKQPRVVQKQNYYPSDEVNREKYTSTMDVALRRRIKVVCAQRGIMFAKFVEDACREKLAKEGNR
jgi:hypothetical protein